VWGLSGVLISLDSASAQYKAMGWSKECLVMSYEVVQEV
jgi:hypothetical protein